MRIDNGNINTNRVINIGKPLEGSHVKPLGNSNANRDKIGIENGQGFKDILRQSIDNSRDIKFSKHATQRMLQRNIKLSTAQLQKMGNALDKARDKGVKDSLLLMENAAFIVNVPTGTIITAVDDGNIREKVFTNIDGAIII